MTDKESPGITSTETLFSGDSPTRSNVSVHVVTSEKGPIQEPTLISSITEYETVFGEPTGSFAQSYYQAALLFQQGYLLWVIRTANLSSTTYASTEFESEDQIQGFQVTGAISVVEGKQAQFTVIAIYGGGQTQDVTALPNTEYIMHDPSLGSVFGGVFFANNVLGSAVIDIIFEGNLTQHTIDIVQLSVDYLDFIGPGSLETGIAAQFRAIAYFEDGSARDVTFDPETVWAPETGVFQSYANGVLEGSTVSIDTINEIRITYKNASEFFPVTITPTYFKLLDAGEASFKIEEPLADLDPDWEGDIVSHTVNWVITQGVNAQVNSPTSLEGAEFEMLSNPDNFYEVTLYIDQGTVNEQSDVVIISSAAYSPLIAWVQGQRNLYDVMLEQARVNVSGGLDLYPDYVIDGTDLEPNHNYVPDFNEFILKNPQTGLVELLWFPIKEDFVEVDSVAFQQWDNTKGNSGWHDMFVMQPTDTWVLADGTYRWKVRYHFIGGITPFNYPAIPQVDIREPFTISVAEHDLQQIDVLYNPIIGWTASSDAPEIEIENYLSRVQRKYELVADEDVVSVEYRGFTPEGSDGLGDFIDYIVRVQKLLSPPDNPFTDKLVGYLEVFTHPTIDEDISNYVVTLFTA